MSTAAVIPLAPAPPRSIDDVLAAARSRLRRLTAREAYRAHRDGGAVLVDIRPAAQRATYGEIPGALVVERNVLEWRFDPRSDARLAIADRYDLPVVIFCQAGYTSSLAAAALQELGLFRATDIAGGYESWYAAGLPVTGFRTAAPPGEPATGDELRIVPEARVVLHRGVEVPLTRREYDLLLHFARHPRRVFSRTALLRTVWGFSYAEPRTVDVHVCRLRTKLGDALPLTTVRGVGYRLDRGPVAIAGTE